MKKSNLLENNRFDEFVQMLINDRHLELSTLAKYVRIVIYFLSHAESITYRGYLRFRKDNSSFLATCGWALPAALNSYLNFMGAGRKRKVTVRKSRVNIMRSVSEDNKKNINDFVIYLRGERDYSQNTLSAYSHDMPVFFSYFNRFTQENCKEFLLMREEKKAAPKTLNHFVGVFLHFAAFCKKNIHLRHYKTQIAVSLDNIPTEDEYKRLLEYLRGRSEFPPYRRTHYWIVLLLGTTGMRISELLQIRWEDIVAGEVSLKCKGNKFRVIRFTPSVQAEAGALVKKNRLTGPVCISRNGTLISPRGISVGLKTWGKAVGIDEKKMHAHAFRHFFAKQYIKRDRDIVHLADILGHGSINTTRIYLARTSEEQRRDFNKYVNW